MGVFRTTQVESVTLPTRAIPVVGQVDVIVCGGGPAGLIAALAAARNGAKTLLIERHGYLGGTLTAGLVLLVAPMNDRAGNLVIRGLPLEFVSRLQRLGGSVGDPCTTTWIPHDPEVTKRLADDMLEEAGVDILLHSHVVDTLKDGAALQGVVVYSKSGFQAVRSRVTIDCTGDADVAVSAGAPYTKEENFLQPMTLSMRIIGVDWPDWPQVPAGLESEYQEGCRASGPPVGQQGHGLFALIHRGECFANATRIAGDGTNVRDLTRAEIEGRKQALERMQWYRAHLTGLRGAFLAQTGSQVGVRETRRIIGEYVITRDDILGARHFADGVARGAYWIDLHDPHSSHTEYVFLSPGKYYTIPYRCLVPQLVDGLLVAGRCISGTHEAMGSYRVMSHCMAIGEAAGTAAALAVAGSCSPRDLDITVLRSALQSQGALV